MRRYADVEIGQFYPHPHYGSKMLVCAIGFADIFGCRTWAIARLEVLCKISIDSDRAAIPPSSRTIHIRYPYSYYQHECPGLLPR